MSALSVLKSAHQLLSVGLAPHHLMWFSAKRDGAPCWHTNEEVFFFSVYGAIIVASRWDEADCMAAWDMLEWVTTPGRTDIIDWVNSPERTTTDVLRAFDLAILRAGRLQ